MKSEKKKNYSERLDKSIYILICIIMIGVPLGKCLSYVPYLLSINEILFKRLRAYFLWVSIIFLLIVYVYGIVSKKRKINYYDILFYILSFLGIVSTLFAVNLDKSIYGEPNRYEGVLTLFSYYLITLNVIKLNNDKYKKNIVYLFIILGTFQGIIGILQSLTNLPFIRRSSIAYMAMGLCSNPNFYGSYVSMLLSIVCIYFINKPSVKNILLIILFSSNLYLAGSTGPVLGFILSFIFMLILNYKKYIKFISLSIIIMLTFFISDNLLKYVQNDILNSNISNRYNIKEDLKQTYQMATSNDKKQIEKIGSGRIKVWKNSLPLVKKYWLTGAGIDNFREVYPQSGNVSFDKAHNVYLQIAVTNGVPALIVYLIICFIPFIKGFKLKDKYSSAIYMAFITYCIQAFSNISVIDVAPYFYIVLGLLIGYEKN